VGTHKGVKGSGKRGVLRNWEKGWVSFITLWLIAPTIITYFWDFLGRKRIFRRFVCREDLGFPERFGEDS